MEATKKGFDFKKFMSDNAMWFVLIILAVALTAVRPRFATVGNLTTLISSESVKGIITCGVCWCILSAGIDLGPGAVAALSAVVSASLAQQADLPTRLISVHMPAVVCIIVAMIIGAIVGIICGWLVACTHIRLSRRWVHSSYVELWQRCTPISRYPIWIRASVISPFTKSAAFRWLYSSS